MLKRSDLAAQMSSKFLESLVHPPQLIVNVLRRYFYRRQSNEPSSCNKEQQIGKLYCEQGCKTFLESKEFPLKIMLYNFDKEIKFC